MNPFKQILASQQQPHQQLDNVVTSLTSNKYIGGFPAVSSVYQSQVSEGSSKSRSSYRSQHSNTSQRLMIFQRVQSIMTENKLSQNMKSLSEKKNIRQKYLLSKQNNLNSPKLYSNIGKHIRSKSTESRDSKQKVKILNQIVEKLKGRNSKVENIKKRSPQRKSDVLIEEDKAQNFIRGSLKPQSTRLVSLLKDVKHANKQNHKAIYTIRKVTIKDYSSSDRIDRKYKLGKILESFNKNEKIQYNQRKHHKANLSIRETKKFGTDSCITCGCICRAKQRAQGQYLDPKKIY